MGPIVGGTRLDTLFTEENYYQTFNAKSGVEERKLTSLWFVGKIGHFGAMWRSSKTSSN